MSIYKVGEKVRITAKDGLLGKHGFDIGDVVVLSHRSEKYDNNPAGKLSVWWAHDGNYHEAWYVHEGEFEKIGEANEQY